MALAKMLSINFTHSGLADCKSCHIPPEDDHYIGQCSDCHNLYNWTDISFDHVGADNCATCHVAPTGHWPGQCYYCHVSTETWTDVIFGEAEGPEPELALQFDNRTVHA